MKVKSFIGLLTALKNLRGVFSAPNAFTSPLNDFSIHAGQTMEINWIETSGEIVSLRLLTGAPENLQAVTPIATGIENTGSTVWKVPDAVPPGKYSMEITANNGAINYSPMFTITDPVSVIPGKNKQVERSGSRSKNKLPKNKISRNNAAGKSRKSRN